MKRMIILLTIHILLIVYTFFRYPNNGEVYILITLPFVVMELFGIFILSQDPYSKAGKFIYIITCIRFIPLSIIGYFGMKSYIEKSINEDNEFYNN